MDNFLTQEIIILLFCDLIRAMQEVSIKDINTGLGM
jgi:hypothetical protein